MKHINSTVAFLAAATSFSIFTLRPTLGNTWLLMVGICAQSLAVARILNDRKMKLCPVKNDNRSSRQRY